MPGASIGASGALHVPDALDVSCLPLGRTRALAELAADGFWSDIRLVASTGSTNADVLAQAARGAPEGLVIAAAEQTAGRGRQGRSWISRPGAALMFSALLRPAQIPPAARGWVPLLAGVATASALRDVPRWCGPGAGVPAMRGVDARLKWPNDIMIGAKKLGGILAEQVGDVIVVGVGVNLLGGGPDLPVPTATSLELHGAGRIDRIELLAGILRQFEHWYRTWRGTCASMAGAGGAGACGAGACGAGACGAGACGAGACGAGVDACGLRAEYLRLSATVGQQVQVHLPGGQLLAGTATGVDDTGRLLVRVDGGDTVPVSAGDVVHVR